MVIQLQADSPALRSLLANTEDELTSVNSRLAALQDDITTKREEINQSRIHLLENAQRCSELASQVQECETHIHQAKFAASVAKEPTALAAIASQIEALNSELANFKQQHETSQVKHDRLEKQQQQHTAKLEKELTKGEDERATLETRREELQHLRDSTDAALSLAVFREVMEGAQAFKLKVQELEEGRIENRRAYQEKDQAYEENLATARKDYAALQSRFTSELRAWPELLASARAEHHLPEPEKRKAAPIDHQRILFDGRLVYLNLLQEHGLKLDIVPVHRGLIVGLLAVSAGDVQPFITDVHNAQEGRAQVFSNHRLQVEMWLRDHPMKMITW